MANVSRFLGRETAILIVTAGGSLGLCGCGSGNPRTPTPPPPAPAHVNPDQRKISGRAYNVSLTSSGKRSRGTPAPGAASRITLQAAGDRVCWKIARMLGIPYPLHISLNRGAAPSTGPVLVTLGAHYRATGCQSPVAPALLLGIERHPADYYLAISDAQHPTGAIRGQL